MPNGFALVKPSPSKKTVSLTDNNDLFPWAYFAAMSSSLSTRRQKKLFASSPCAELKNMSKDSTFPTSPLDDLDEAPPITQEHVNRAIHRVNLAPVPARKQKISITLDPDVIAWFKERAGERGYQTLINATLRDAMQQRRLEDCLRQVIREEIGVWPPVDAK